MARPSKPFETIENIFVWIDKHGGEDKAYQARKIIEHNNGVAERRGLDMGREIKRGTTKNKLSYKERVWLDAVLERCPRLCSKTIAEIKEVLGITVEDHITSQRLGTILKVANFEVKYIRVGDKSHRVWCYMGGAGHD